MKSVYDVLDFPLVYRAAGHLFAPMGAYNLGRKFERIFAERPEIEKVLDVGCGPRFLLEATGLALVGVDISEGYVRAIEAEGGEAYVAPCDALPFDTHSFDAAWTCGLFHHVPDDVAARAVEEMIRVTRPGGLVVVSDAVLPKRRVTRALALAIRKLDRGGYMRDEAALERLLPEGTPHTSERYTYALTGLENLVIRIPIAA